MTEDQLKQLYNYTNRLEDALIQINKQSEKIGEELKSLRSILHIEESRVNTPPKFVMIPEKIDYIIKRYCIVYKLDHSEFKGTGHQLKKPYNNIRRFFIYFLTTDCFWTSFQVAKLFEMNRSSISTSVTTLKDEMDRNRDLYKEYQLFEEEIIKMI